jgi:hypothetical protein
MRADIHDGSEHTTLQSEAGYIDAKTASAGSTKPLAPQGPGSSPANQRLASQIVAVQLDQVERVQAHARVVVAVADAIEARHAVVAAAQPPRRR